MSMYIHVYKYSNTCILEINCTLILKYEHIFIFVLFIGKLGPQSALFQDTLENTVVSETALTNNILMP